MALSNSSILAHMENWRVTLEHREVDASTVLDSIADAIIKGQEPEPQPEPAATSKIVVTNHYGASAEYDGADSWSVTDGQLIISVDDTNIACHAAGTWEAVKYVEA